MADIKINHIYKNFGDQVVLNDVTASVPIGETTVITGKSGCGKTTLLSILMGTLIADSGTIEGMAGKKVSAVFQEERLLESMSVLKNIQLVCERSKKVSEIEYLLQQLELNNCLHKKVAKLSGGMKRRVSIARALSVSFDLLFLDEALKGLDPGTKETVTRVVREYTKGKTVIRITHDIEEIEEFQGKRINLEGFTII